MDAPEKYQGFGLQLKFATTEGREEREILLYGFVSFVSEFGGALGLFLGLSFLSFWDVIENICKVKKNLTRPQAFTSENAWDYFM